MGCPLAVVSEPHLIRAPRIDFPHFVNILYAEDFLTLQELHDAFSEVTGVPACFLNYRAICSTPAPAGDVIPLLGEKAQSIAGLLTMKGKKALRAWPQALRDR